MTKEGRLQFSVRFPKFKKGGYSVHKEVADPTYGKVTCTHELTVNDSWLTYNDAPMYKCCIISAGYTGTLMHNLVAMFLHDPEKLETSMHEMQETVPRPLAADCERPNKHQAVKDFKSRFSKSMRT